MSELMTKVSIILVSWNTSALLKQCLESVFAHTQGCSFQVFVVDNNSSDDSVEMVERSFPAVHVLRNAENVGFARANNQAIRASRGEYVVLLNPDTLLLANTFKLLADAADRESSIGAIGPMIYCGDGRTVQRTCARRYPRLLDSLWHATGIQRLWPAVVRGPYLADAEYSRSQDVPVLSGACMMVRSRAVAQVGLLDEELFMYADEVDWCKRLGDAGWRVHYLAEGPVIHYGGESAKRSSANLSLVVVRSMHHYYRKHCGQSHALRYLRMLYVTTLLRRAACGLSAPLSHRRRLQCERLKEIASWVSRELTVSRRMAGNGPCGEGASTLEKERGGRDTGFSADAGGHGHSSDGL